MKLNPAQQDCANDILQHFENSSTPQILNWYTGSGKTNIFLWVALEVLKKNPLVKIGISSYLHRSIKLQTAKRLRSINSEVIFQVIEAGKDFDPKAQIYIFNPQTIHRRNSDFKLDYLIVDESHVGFNPDSVMLARIKEKFCHSRTKVLAVSATSWDLREQEFFRESQVYSRGLNFGIADGRTCDFQINVEKLEVETDDSDFGQDGNLRQEAQTRLRAQLRRMCKTKIEKLLEKQTLGSKVLVIVPPGNDCALAHYVASLLLGKSVLSLGGGDEERELAEFRYNPNKQFLIVVNKHKVGFDMSELTDIVDLTMTRSIKEIVQRFGRIARVAPAEKRYWFVYDKNLEDWRVEWLLNTSIRFACCDYSGLEPNIYRTRTSLFGINFNEPLRFSELSTRILSTKLETKSQRSFLGGKFSSLEELIEEWESLYPGIKPTQGQHSQHPGLEISLYRALEKVARYQPEVVRELFYAGKPYLFTSNSLKKAFQGTSKTELYKKFNRTLQKTSQNQGFFHLYHQVFQDVGIAFELQGGLCVFNPGGRYLPFKTKPNIDSKMVYKRRRKCRDEIEFALRYPSEYAKFEYLRLGKSSSYKFQNGHRQEDEEVVYSLYFLMAFFELNGPDESSSVLRRKVEMGKDIANPNSKIHKELFDLFEIYLNKKPEAFSTLREAVERNLLSEAFKKIEDSTIGFPSKKIFNHYLFAQDVMMYYRNKKQQFQELEKDLKSQKGSPLTTELQAKIEKWRKMADHKPTRKERWEYKKRLIEIYKDDRSSKTFRKLVTTKDLARYQREQNEKIQKTTR